MDFCLEAKCSKLTKERPPPLKNLRASDGRMALGAMAKYGRTNMVKRVLYVLSKARSDRIKAQENVTLTSPRSHAPVASLLPTRVESDGQQGHRITEDTISRAFMQCKSCSVGHARRHRAHSSTRDATGCKGETRWPIAKLFLDRGAEVDFM